MRTQGSFNHPGPMKRPIAILLQTQVSILGWVTIRRPAGLAWVAARAGPFLTERPHSTASG